jgi:hypothetical protein
MIVRFLDTLMLKWGVFDKISTYAMKSESKFLYDFSTCNFCINFHLGWITTIGIVQFYDFEWMFLLIPFCVSGLLKILE